MHIVFLIAGAAVALLLLVTAALNFKALSDDSTPGPTNGAERLALLGQAVGAAGMLLGFLLSPWLVLAGSLVAAFSYAASGRLMRVSHQRNRNGARIEESRLGLKPSKLSPPSTGWLLALITVGLAAGYLMTAN